MDRNLQALAGPGFDLLVIGGGIHGACVARDAALRGLAVALVERGDFGEATSGNSLGIVHGGLRYLQHADLRRARASVRERAAWLRVAGHLVRPLPVLVPTYGGLRQGRALLAAALLAGELLALDRNRNVPVDRRLPAGRLLSRRECEARFPAVDPRGLTGGVLFYDALMLDPDRLTLSVVQSAAEAGAVVANHLEATRFLRSGARVTGVEARDRLSGERLAVRARVTVNAAGPWTFALLARLDHGPAPATPPLALAMNLVLGRSLTSGCAVGLPGRPGPYRFLVPCAGRSAVGTFYRPHAGDPDDAAVVPGDVERCLDELARSRSRPALGPADVRRVHAGLLPCARAAAGGVRLARRHRVYDHRRLGGPGGLLSVVGVKYTTARLAAEEAVDLAFACLGSRPPPAVTAARPLYGAPEGSFGALAREAERACAGRLAHEAARRLAERYGTAYRELLALVERDPALAEPLAGGVGVLGAEVVHAIRSEMARTLADVVVRRTGLGSAGMPTAEALAACAALAARELGWNAARTEQEVAAVRRALEGWRGAAAG